MLIKSHRAMCYQLQPELIQETSTRDTKFLFQHKSTVDCKIHKLRYALIHCHKIKS